MNHLHLLWDASGLTKRYAQENGSEVVDALFGMALQARMVGTYLGYVESAATLWRRRNRGLISQRAFGLSLSSMRTEVLLTPTFRVLTIEDNDFLAAVTYVQQHNLNASDAAILVTYLRHAAAQATSDRCVLVAADQRLLRAASAEGLRTLNPETLVPADVPAFLASL